MGGTNWSDAEYKSRASFRSATKAPVFAFHEAVESGSVDKKAHESLDPKLIKGVRESRDSAEHPNSNAVGICFDNTGSMRDVPKILQKNLIKLMGLLLRKSYLTDPAIMIASHGDRTDRVPLQNGQFESGIEIEDNLTNLYLEGGGGGNLAESPEFFLYLLANLTAIDCWEKRGRKGYAFIITDEMAYDKLPANEIKSIFGDNAAEARDWTIDELIAKVQERYNLYVIMPKMTAHWGDTQIEGFWKKRLNQNFLKLEDPEGISEFIASVIGTMELDVDEDTLVSDLVSEGADKGVANTVSRALTPLRGSRGTTTVPKTGLATL